MPGNAFMLWEIQRKIEILKRLRRSALPEIVDRREHENPFTTML